MFCGGPSRPNEFTGTAAGKSPSIGQGAKRKLQKPCPSVSPGIKTDWDEFFQLGCRASAICARSSHRAWRALGYHDTFCTFPRSCDQGAKQSWGCKEVNAGKIGISSDGLRDKSTESRCNAHRTLLGST